jgi:hypothetical protein
MNWGSIQSRISGAGGLALNARESSQQPTRETATGGASGVVVEYGRGNSLTFFVAGLLYLLCLEHVDNLGAYRIPSGTGLLIPSDASSISKETTAKVLRVRVSTGIRESLR